MDVRQIYCSRLLCALFVWSRWKALRWKIVIEPSVVFGNLHLKWIIFAGLFFRRRDDCPKLGLPNPSFQQWFFTRASRIVKLVIVRNFYVLNVWKILFNQPCLCCMRSKDDSVEMVFTTLLCFISSWRLMSGEKTRVWSLYRVIRSRYWMWTGGIENNIFCAVIPLNCIGNEQNVCVCVFLEWLGLS